MTSPHIIEVLRTSQLPPLNVFPFNDAPLKAIETIGKEITFFHLKADQSLLPGCLYAYYPIYTNKYYAINDVQYRVICDVLKQKGIEPSLVEMD